MASSTDLSRDSSQDGLSRNPSQDSPPTPSSVLSATGVTTTASKILPRHQLAVKLSGLYSEIIAAKLWKVAEEYLEDGVSLPLDVLQPFCTMPGAIFLTIQAEGSIPLP
jgi:hypothetical protein